MEFVSSFAPWMVSVCVHVHYLKGDGPFRGTAKGNKSVYGDVDQNRERADTC